MTVHPIVRERPDECQIEIALQFRFAWCEVPFAGSLRLVQSTYSSSLERTNFAETAILRLLPVASTYSKL